MAVEERGSENGIERTERWLDVRAIARVHASSEQQMHRIDAAFSADAAAHWRAAEPGEQVIELYFDPPRDLTRIRLLFVEEETPRTQEFTIRWSSRRGETHGEIVRQQFNFSPSGASREMEDYAVELRGVERLQIHVIPDIGHRPVHATLARLQLA
jgi:hypothetical protein